MACHGSPPHSRRSPWRQYRSLTRYENMASQDPAFQIPRRLTAHPLPSPRHSRSGRVFLPLFFRPITYPVFVVRKQRTVVPSRRASARLFVLIKSFNIHSFIRSFINSFSLKKLAYLKILLYLCRQKM